MTTTSMTSGEDLRHLPAIEAVVADLQTAQRNEDVDGFVGLFHPQATWVTGHGRRLIGRDEIAAFTRSVLPGAMATTHTSYEVVHVVFVRPDVAIVAVPQRVLSLDDVPLDEAEGRPTYVMTTDETGAWRIIGGQNTAVHTP